MTDITEDWFYVFGKGSAQDTPERFNVRRLINDQNERYHAAARGSKERSDIVKGVIDTVKNEGGHFMKRLPDGSHVDVEDDVVRAHLQTMFSDRRPRTGESPSPQEASIAVVERARSDDVSIPTFECMSLVDDTLKFPTDIDKALKEIGTEAFHDIEQIRNIPNTIEGLSKFRLEIERGSVSFRLKRLTNVQTAAVQRGMTLDVWAETYAKSLLPRDEYEDYTDEAHLEFNEYDADRKVCVEILKAFQKAYEACGRPRNPTDYLPARMVVDILSHTLVMDRAKALYFMPRTGQVGERGLHWYAQKHVESQEKWSLIQETYAGDPTISKRIVWYVESQDYGPKLSRANLLHYMEPHVAFGL